MKIEKCRINHMYSPLGFNLDKPTVSWTVTETMAKKQETARIIVTDDESFDNILFDTGEKSDISNLGFLLPIELVPRKKYYWKVTIKADNGEIATSEIQWFETGKISEKWEARWISPEWEDKSIRPLLRRKFTLEQNIKNAKAYVVGVGMYDLFVNGSKVGDEYFAPACTTFESWIQSYTYDVTEELQKGENVVGAMLGNGWAKTAFGVFGPLHQQPTDTFGLLLELRITLEDNTEVIINSDTDWTCEKSPVLYDNFYQGEIFDATQEQKDWSKPNFNDSTWSKVVYHEQTTLGKIEDRLSMPIRKKEKFAACEIILTKKNEYIIDFGQNIAGWIAFKDNELNGTKIKLSYTEILQDECFYNENLRSAKQEFHYTSNGENQIVEPHFVYYGFRYVMVEGLANPPKAEDFVAHAIYSDLEETGFITTSDSKVNRLFENAKWSQKSNFIDVPTDCPQRDERMGWTGDAQVFSETASFNMETYEFYKKYLKDVWSEQQYRDGMVSNFVPAFLGEKVTNNNNGVNGGQAVWGDVATIVPWRLYLHYGDKSILIDQYESMKAWVNWILREVNKGNSYIWSTGFQFGDWLALDGPQDRGLYGGTDETYIATAFFMYSAEILSKTAKVLGNIDDENYYRDLSIKIKKDLYDEYFTANGRLSINTQTAHLLALYLKLVPEKFEQRVAADLVQILEKDNMHLKTGFTGTPYLCRVLSSFGYSDVAYRIFFQEDYPSWLYEVNMGATTIWERWNSILPDGKISGTGMNSLNHYAYGSIAEWMYQSICGLQNIEESPGFKEFELKPQFNGKLDFAELEYLSPMGKIKSKWILINNEVKYEFTIPFGSVAKVYLQDADINTIKCNVDKKWSIAEENYSLSLFEAGNYVVSFNLNRNINAKYSFDFTFNELFKVSELKPILALVDDRISFMPKHLRPELNKPFNIAISEISEDAYNEINSHVNLKELEIKIGEYPIRRKY